VFKQIIQIYEAMNEDDARRYKKQINGGGEPITYIYQILQINKRKLTIMR
jgi:hypothetical protein